jgi:hypothetical protein
MEKIKKKGSSSKFKSPSTAKAVLSNKKIETFEMAVSERERQPPPSIGVTRFEEGSNNFINKPSKKMVVMK